MGKTFSEKLKDRIENYPRLFNVMKKVYYLLFQEQTADFGSILFNIYELGIEQRGLKELLDHFKHGNKPVQKEAAWQLAMWHSNHFCREDAQKALEYLPFFKKYEKNKRRLEQACYLEAECFALINKKELASTVVSKGVQKNCPEKYTALMRYTQTRKDQNKLLKRFYEWYNLDQVSIDDNGLPVALNAMNLTAAEQNAECSVSIILPVSNSVEGLELALRSLVQQTWKFIEIIIIDQGSADDTAQIVQNFQANDNRIRLIEYSNCRSFFDALNRGYEEANGNFVTGFSINSWAHPRLIEKQVHHLKQNAKSVANMVKSLRYDENGIPYRGKEPATYLFTDLLSLMFRKNRIKTDLGYWDSVREGAEREFLARIRKYYGNESVATLSDGPLLWKFYSSSQSGTFIGYVKQNYLFDSAQRRYIENYRAFHNSGSSLYIQWPQTRTERKILAPRVLLPEHDLDTLRHFDVIDVSDFRLPGGNTSSIGEELKAQKKEGLTTGLIQMPLYGFSREKPLSDRIQSQIDEEKVQWIGVEEKVSCDILILRHPPVLQDDKRLVSKVRTDNIAVVINQAPRRDYGGPIEKTFIYDFAKCNANLLKYFGTEGVWYPNGSVLRDTLKTQHKEEIDKLIFAEKDWANIIDISEWERTSRPEKGSKIRIGRHSRDHYVKWPNDAETIRQVYPNSDRYEIHVLGGARSVKRVVSPLPKNWRVYEFGSMQPKDFLASLDVFVYFHHPDWVEPFGRNIFEAMTVGVPVITAPHFKSLYRDAAIYAHPAEVQEKIEELMQDDELHERQVQKARAFIIDTFGYQRHLEQVRKNFSYYSRKK
jgi:glycosyltransferase involved in cell wall biosynthesis